MWIFNDMKLNNLYSLSSHISLPEGAMQSVFDFFVTLPAGYESVTSSIFTLIKHTLQRH